ncbi:MAG: bifunctional phosphoribosylaminoimidazolecarboxamide formyltransferase/IMP cyclohydrolase, partial [Bacteroidota bacterium]
MKKISSVLVSVYHKEGLDDLLNVLTEIGVDFYSTGGTRSFLESKNIEVKAVEDLTGYPSILGGRVKTLHPKVFGGILFRAEEQSDMQALETYEIPQFDLVIVDLYPFEDTLASGASEQEIIEKIDIGGISLIRAAAKNFKEVAVISSRQQYNEVARMLKEQSGALDLVDRKKLAAQAFDISSHYDTAIHQYFMASITSDEVPPLKVSYSHGKQLRYGENPHQSGVFYGELDELLEQLNGKALSYNNLVDIDAAVALIEEFDRTAFAIIKHTNACGMAIADNNPKAAYLKALAGDPVSAFGGVIATNDTINLEVATELHKLFFEVLIAPAYEEDALALLKQKKKRILLKKRRNLIQKYQIKSILDGVIYQ